MLPHSALTTNTYEYSTLKTESGTPQTHHSGENQDTECTSLTDRWLTIGEEQELRSLMTSIGEDERVYEGLTKTGRDSTSSPTEAYCLHIRLWPTSCTKDKTSRKSKSCSGQLRNSRHVVGHSWRWGGGNAEGKVAEIVEEGKAEVTSNKVRFQSVPVPGVSKLKSHLRM